MRALYYALGGGLGHFTRSLALGRHYARLTGGEHVLCINTPFAQTAARMLAAESRRQPEVAARLKLVTLDPTANAAEVALELHPWLEAWRPTDLVVDTFPRGIGGELANILPTLRGVRRILIARTLPRQYVVGYDLAPFVAEQFEIVLVPGEPSPYGEAVATIDLPPFLIRDTHELLPAAAARAQTIKPAVAGSNAESAARLPTGKTPAKSIHPPPILLVVGSGTRNECRNWLALFEGLLRYGEPPGCDLRFAVPDEAAADIPAAIAPFRVLHLPLFEVLPMASVVVGCGGYNLVHETSALGLDALWIPRPRRYDDQTQRTKTSLQAIDLQAVISRLGRRTIKSSPRPREFENGARLAAERLVELRGKG